MLSPNLPKSQISFTVGGGQGAGIQLLTFDAGSISARIPNSLYGGGGGSMRGGWVDQLSKVNFKLFKPKS